LIILDFTIKKIMPTLEIKNTISINAPALKVWEILTKSEYTKIYMFGCSAISDWKEGSSLLWNGTYEGIEMTFVKGEVLEFKPFSKLIYTVFDPNSTIEDIPENYLNVTYELLEADGITTLNVTQGDYSKVAEGERRYQESYNNGEGWNPILVNIKMIAEKECL
jgi:uncharacterized protein YndB with AHSA1/START domain